MALTATATERVRADIVEQLQLREPQMLRRQLQPAQPDLPRAAEGRAPTSRCSHFVRARPQRERHHLLPSRKTAETRRANAERGRHYGASLITPGSTPTNARENQERSCATKCGSSARPSPSAWASTSPTSVSSSTTICRRTSRATTRKPAARAATVCRANACCSSAPATSVKQTRFIDEKTEPHEAARSRARSCSRWCTTPRAPTAAAPTLLRLFRRGISPLTNLRRLRQLPRRRARPSTARSPRRNFSPASIASAQKSGFGVGLNHIVEVLTGADTEKIRQRGHNELSTYGIGKELKRDDWQAIGRELLAARTWSEVAPGKFATLQVTGSRPRRACVSGLRSRSRNRWRSRREREASRRRNRMRRNAVRPVCATVRRTLADERNVPAYIIFSDVALREMARSYPTTPAEFRRIPGVGEQKLKDFAESFLAAINAYLSEHPRRRFPPADR